MASVFFALFRTFFHLHFLLSIEGKDSREKSARVRLRILKRFVILSREVMSEKGEEETPMKKCIVAPDSFKGSLSSRAACDIDSPMHGLQGAAYVFAPQKGASEEEVRVLDAGLKSVEGVMTRKLGRSLAAVPGAGAAGAMGAGVLAFLGGKLKSGIDTVLDVVDFEGLLAGADLVITGEGRVDAQSCRGKVIAGIAARAKRRGVPVVVLAGSVESGSEGLYDCGVTAMFSINRKCEPFEVSRHQARENLSSAVDNLLRLWLQVERPG